MICLMALSGCSSSLSDPVVAKCPQRTSLPAWVMQKEPSLMNYLDRIISVSETASGEKSGSLNPASQ